MAFYPVINWNSEKMYKYDAWGGSVIDTKVDVWCAYDIQHDGTRWMSVYGGLSGTTYRNKVTIWSDFFTTIYDQFAVPTNDVAYWIGWDGTNVLLKRASWGTYWKMVGQTGVVDSTLGRDGTYDNQKGVNWIDTTGDLISCGDISGTDKVVNFTGFTLTERSNFTCPTGDPYGIEVFNEATGVPRVGSGYYADTVTNCVYRLVGWTGVIDSTWDPEYLTPYSIKWEYVGAPPEPEPEPTFVHNIVQKFILVLG